MWFSQREPRSFARKAETHMQKVNSTRITSLRCWKCLSKGPPRCYWQSTLSLRSLLVNHPSILNICMCTNMCSSYGCHLLWVQFFHANYNLALTFEKWGLLFLFQSSITQTFSTNYGFSVFQTSLIQLSLSAGATIATAVNPLQDQLYLRSAGRNKETPGKPIPEARLYFSIPGSLIFTAGLFVYGWTSYTFVPWIAPAVGIAMVGFGIYSIYQAVVVSTGWNFLGDRIC